MIETIVDKINIQIKEQTLAPYKIDEYFLSKLYNGLLKECVNYEMIEHFLVAFGILHLHLQSHARINQKTSLEDLSAAILDGDYFYSLYYEYCATHLFELIEMDFANRLKQAEITAIYDDYPSLLTSLKTTLQKGGIPHELFS